MWGCVTVKTGMTHFPGDFCNGPADLKIYKEDELQSEATHRKFLFLRRETERDVQRPIDHYNHDRIISVRSG